MTCIWHVIDMYMKWNWYENTYCKYIINICVLIVYYMCPYCVHIYVYKYHIYHILLLSNSYLVWNSLDMFGLAVLQMPTFGSPRQVWLAGLPQRLHWAWCTAPWCHMCQFVPITCQSQSHNNHWKYIENHFKMILKRYLANHWQIMVSSWWPFGQDLIKPQNSLK